jgi:hypothetical protein
VDRISFPTLLALSLIGWAGPRAARGGEDWKLPGSVRDAVSGGPIEGAEILSGDVRVVSDPEGAFEMTLSSDKAELRIEAAGYFGTQIAVAQKEISKPLEIELFPRNVFLERVDVRETVSPPAEPSTFEVAPSDVFQVAGSADNIYRTLDTLPGVAATEDFGSRLSVRGGSPDQNLTVMDGVEIHNPFRLSGITSAFNPETIESFELTVGGFGARYGDRLSSVLAVDNRVGARSFGGSTSVSITDANMVVEGAIPGNGSWLFTGRRTYYDLVAGLIHGDELPSFADLQAQVAWELGPGRRISLVGLRSRENSDFARAESDGDRLDVLSDAGNDLVSASFESLLGPRWRSSTTASWYRNRDFGDFDVAFRQEGKRSNAADDDVAYGLDQFVFYRDFRLRDWSLRQHFGWDPSSRHSVELGAELHSLATGVRWESFGEDRNLQEANGSSVRGGAGLPDQIDSTLHSTRGGLWVQDRWQPGRRLALEPGLRLDWSTANRRSTLSPRFAATFDFGAGTTARAAFGLYSQSPGYEKLIQSDYFLDLSEELVRELDYERATHFVLGFRKELGPQFSARVEGYYKSFSELIVGRLETEAERLSRVARYDFPRELQSSIPAAPIITSVPSNESSGRAYGLEFFLERRDPSAKISGWASYTLGKAEREAYSRTYPLEYDRRHALSLAGRYRFGDRFDIALTARLASGFPYTPAVGLRVAADEDERGMLVPAVDPEGNLVYAADLGDVQNLNSGRMPLYARFDLRATFRPGGFTGRWSFYAEVINLFNRNNAVVLESWLVHDPTSDLPRLVEVPGEGFPLLPSAGVRFRF